MNAGAATEEAKRFAEKSEKVVIPSEGSDDSGHAFYRTL
jgi:hypothetical protein